MGLVAGPASAATGPVSSTPAAGTPQLAPTGTTEQVRQLVQCGGTMYAVGSFTSIKRYSSTFTRTNAFSFSATSPYMVTSWDPEVNGTVNSIAFSPDCSIAYLGGAFTSIGGTAVKNIAAVSTSTGAVISTFGHSANGQVETLLYYNGHLLTGGYYTSINNGTADPYMTSLNPSTGKDDGFIHLSISGNYQFPGVDSNPTRVYNQQLSNSGTLDLVEGDFTSVGGQPRQQMFMLDLSGSTAAVTGWTTSELNTNCNYNEPFYAQAASWSPDDSTIYVATTGYKPAGSPAGATPGPGRVTRRSPTRPRRPASRTPGSTTPAATRCTPPPPTPAPPTSAATRDGQRTRTTVTPRAPGPSPHPAWRVWIPAAAR